MAPSILVTFSYSSFIQLANTLAMGVMQNMQKARSRPAGACDEAALIHFFSLGLK